MSRHQFSPTPASPSAHMTYSFTVTTLGEAVQQRRLHHEAGVECIMKEDYMNHYDINGNPQGIKIWHFFTEA